MITAQELRVVGRRALPWLVGPVALMLRGRPIEIVAPNACPGLVELGSVVVLRIGPDLAVGRVLGALQAILVTAALAAFVELAFRSTGSVCTSVGTGLAVGLSPL